MRSPKRSGRWSLRTRLLVLSLVPIICLAGVWAFAAFLASRDAIGKYEASTAYQKVTIPGAKLEAALQRERTVSAVLLSSGGREDGQEVTDGRAAVDAAQAEFRRSALSNAAQRSVNPTTRQRLDDLWQQLDGLAALRGRVDSGSADDLRVMEDYGTLIESVIRVFGTMIVVDDAEIYQQGTALVESAMARELVMREDALVTSTLTTRRHRLTAPAYDMFARSAYNERYLFDSARSRAKISLRAPWEKVAGSPDFTAFRSLEDEIIGARPGARLPARTASWKATVEPLMTAWSQATIDAGRGLTDETRPIKQRSIFFLALTAAVGLVALAVSIVVSLLFGRTLAREMAALQRAALDLAQVRLPQLVKRLRAGEEVDVDAESPPVRGGGSKEVARVADALGALQRTAVEAAVGEAQLRKGINKVFLNLAWRNQSLLHRQLTMLDAMEKRARDPDVLDDLFALDHLTTRMRRHAEGVAILSGAAPARGWQEPVGIKDILRAAIAEVEDYTRVVVEAATPAAFDGAVVADTTHLLAELIENATAFSPPTNQVQVRGELVAHGYAIEVEDRGIGLDDEELAEANEKLANPPEFDLLDSDRLGLFIVGRLAGRHGIRVTLGASPYGGVRAVVLVPPDLLAGDEGFDSDGAWSAQPAVDAAWRAVAEVEAPADPAWHAVAEVAPSAAPLPPSPAAPLELTAPVGAGERAEEVQWSDGAPWQAEAQWSQEAPWSEEAPWPEEPQWPDDRPAWSVPDWAGSGWAGDDIQAPYEGWTDPDAPELPRRVRQANLAPQLRREPVAPEPAAGDAMTTRPPEETRSLMASLQRGWQRGRQAPDLDE
ncbi:nitrate- and nitrite sensing domain-containing protein [Actinoallomurus spadix]|uniref:histidine kinase n=1 Tax=Actinoallomurus spadix TaxID=79912 RepID=A0ABN0W0N0_9ACTN|nr:nitrate- and nitrite sensing domain-containing protein [Actinoallomurus spadix]MCO5988212.1 nitrate- and nitrite sensing domain-containing protein [Actinoallomurus spadix]